MLDAWLPDIVIRPFTECSVLKKRSKFASTNLTFILSPEIMSPPKEEFGYTESAWPPSDDEGTPFRGKRVEEKKRNHWKLSFVVSSLGFLIVATFYVKLWIHSTGLESELRGLKPELFPC